MTFTNPPPVGTIRLLCPDPRWIGLWPVHRSRAKKSRNRHAARLRKSAAVRMTSNKQGVLRVRLSLVCATVVAGPLSLCFMIAPAAAQAPPGVPGGARPAGQVGPAGPAGPAFAPAAAPTAAPTAA